MVIYTVVIVSLGNAWSRIPVYKTEKTFKEIPVSISVIVALRNEESSLPHLIETLLAQEGSSFSMEAILVDDHSTDNTSVLISNYAKKHAQIKLVQLDGDSSGKKAALKAGAQEANGELLCFTDADCSPGPLWLESFAGFYTIHNKPEMIIGLVDMKSDSILSELFRVEFLSMILSGAGSYNIGHPTLCNGANLAAKASSYKNYFPESRAVSGDDVFLLHQIKKNTGYIVLIKSKENLILTKGISTIKAFIKQRRRWASKSVFYKDAATIFLALVVLVSNLSLIGAIIICFTNKGNYLTVLIAYTLKLIPDYYIFFKGKEFFRLKSLILKILLIDLFYPIYIAYTAFTSIKKPFEWKGRRQTV